MDTWKRADLGVRTECWDRALERCREFMTIPAVDRQCPEQPDLDADGSEQESGLEAS